MEGSASPAGFGPLAPHWQPRVAFAGTYDEAWRNDRQPLLPADFDDRFYQCAPQDQQTPSFLRGGEPVVLYHLTPGGELRFSLPKLFLGFVTQFSDRSREVHQDRRLHTVIIDTDGPRVSLVWHTALPPLARLAGVGNGFEENRIKTDTVCTGKGLTSAFRGALETLPDGATVTDIFCDMNGEPYRADEFGFACLRTRPAFRSPSELRRPQRLGATCPPRSGRWPSRWRPSPARSNTRMASTP